MYHMYVLGTVAIYNLVTCQGTIGLHFPLISAFLFVVQINVEW